MLQVLEPRIYGVCRQWSALCHGQSVLCASSLWGYLLFISYDLDSLWIVWNVCQAVNRIQLHSCPWIRHHGYRQMACRRLNNFTRSPNFSIRSADWIWLTAVCFVRLWKDNYLNLLTLFLMFQTSWQVAPSALQSCRSAVFFRCSLTAWYSNCIRMFQCSGPCEGRMMWHRSLCQGPLLTSLLVYFSIFLWCWEGAR